LVEEEDVEVLLALEEALVALDPASVAVVAKVRAKSRVESDRIIVSVGLSTVTGNGNKIPGMPGTRYGPKNMQE
jgi:hypothetical protein